VKLYVVVELLSITNFLTAKARLFSNWAHYRSK